MSKSKIIKKSSTIIKMHHHFIKSFIKIELDTKFNKEEEDNYFNYDLKTNKISIEHRVKNNVVESHEIKVNKIFTDNENSYIYEEVCKDVSNEFVSGKDFCFIGYGMSNSCKTETMLFKIESIDDVSKRGIFPRLVEQILSKKSKNQKLKMNLIFEYNGRIIELDKFPLLNSKDYPSNEDIENSLENIIEFKNYSKGNITINEEKDYIQLLKKVLLSIFNLERYDQKFYSRSSIVIHLTLSNEGNKKHYNTLTFVVFPNNTVENFNFSDEEMKLAHVSHMQKANSFNIRFNLKFLYDRNEMISTFNSLISLKKDYDKLASENLIKSPNKKQLTTIAETKSDCKTPTNINNMNNFNSLNKDVGSVNNIQISNLLLENKDEIKLKENEKNIENSKDTIKTKIFDDKKEISDNTKSLKDFIDLKNSKIVYLLRNVFNVDTKFIFLGFLNPSGPTSYNKVKDTLTFIKKCQLGEKSEKLFKKHDIEFESKNESLSLSDDLGGFENFGIEKNNRNLDKLFILKEEENYQLTVKNKELQDEVSHLLKLNGVLKDNIKKNNNTFNSKLNIIAKAFGFEGDINKITFHGDLEENKSIEAIKAKEIRTAKGDIVTLKNKIVNLEESLSKAKRLYEQEKCLRESMRDTRTLVGLYQKNEFDKRENYITDKHQKEISSKMETLIKEKENLTSKLKVLDEEIKEKNEIIKKLTSNDIMFGRFIKTNKSKSKKNNDETNKIENELTHLQKNKNEYDKLYNDIVNHEKELQNKNKVIISAYKCNNCKDILVLNPNPVNDNPFLKEIKDKEDYFNVSDDLEKANKARNTRYEITNPTLKNLIDEYNLKISNYEDDILFERKKQQTLKENHICEKHKLEDEIKSWKKEMEKVYFNIILLSESFNTMFSDKNIMERRVELALSTKSKKDMLIELNSILDLKENYVKQIDKVFHSFNNNSYPLLYSVFDGHLPLVKTNSMKINPSKTYFDQNILKGKNQNLSSLTKHSSKESEFDKELKYLNIIHNVIMNESNEKELLNDKVIDSLSVKYYSELNTLKESSKTIKILEYEKFNSDFGYIKEFSNNISNINIYDLPKMDQIVESLLKSVLIELSKFKVFILKYDSILINNLKKMFNKENEQYKDLYAEIEKYRNFLKVCQKENYSLKKQLSTFQKDGNLELVKLSGNNNIFQKVTNIKPNILHNMVLDKNINLDRPKSVVKSYSNFTKMINNEKK